MTELPDTQKLNAATPIMAALGTVMCGVGRTIKGLSELMGLMDDGIFTDSPMTKIMKNKKQFSEWFGSIAIFVRDGILAPVTGKLKVESLMLAANIIVAMTKVATSIVPMIKGLAEAIALATDAPSFWADTPMAKIVKAKDTFALYFRQIAIFMRDGIIVPVMEEMDGVDITKAAGVLRSMMSIVGTVGPMIKGLAGVVGLMSEDAAKAIDTDFPLDKIVDMRATFSDFFRKTAIFLRDGIVDPILTEMPEPGSIMKAGQILGAMVNVIAQIPKVVNGIAGGLVPLVETSLKDPIKDTASEIISESAGNFRTFFCGVVELLRDGIVMPIVDEMPEPGIILKAGQIMSATTNVIATLKNTILALASLIGPLNSNDCLKEAPVNMIGRSAAEYAYWFGATFALMRYGIIDPIIALMPDAKLIKEVKERLDGMMLVMNGINPLITRMVEMFGIYDPNKTFEAGPVTMLGVMAKLFTQYFTNVARFLRQGIIEPIMSYLPDSTQIEATFYKLANMYKILRIIPTYLANVVKAMAPLNPRGMFRDSPIVTIMNSTKYFTEWFQSLAKFMYFGIISPMMNYFPEEKDMIQALEKLDNMQVILGRLPNYMDSIVQALEPLNPKELEGMAPIRQIIESVDTYQVWFTNLAAFLWNGIAYPITKYFPEESHMIDALNKLNNMQAILGEMPGYMDSVVQALEPLMPKVMLGNAPIKDIMMAVNEYEGWMMGLAAFLWNGITYPIIRYFPEDNHVEDAVNKLDNIQVILKRLPGYMESVVTAFEPLNPKEMMGVAPIRAVIMAATEYEAWMKGLAAFLWNGVTNPILTFFPEDEHVASAVAKLNNMNKVLEVIPKYLEKVVEIMKVIDPRDLLADTPLRTLKNNYEMYRGWLQAMGAFVWNGIILSIEDFLPEVADGRNSLRKLQTTSLILDEMPATITSLSKTLGSLSALTEVFSMNAGMTNLIKGTTNMAFAISKGIIEPLNNLLPEDSELLSVLRKLEITSLILADISEALRAMNMEMMETMTMQMVSTDIAGSAAKEIGFDGLETVQETFSAASTAAMTGPMTTFQAVASIGQYLLDTATSIVGMPAKIFQEAMSIGAAIGGGLIDSATFAFNLPGEIYKGITNIGSSVGSMVMDVSQSMYDMMPQIYKDIAGFGISIGNSLMDTANSILNLPGKAFDSLIGMGSSLGGTLLDSVASLFGNKTASPVEDPNAASGNISTARMTSEEVIRSRIAAKRVMEEPPQAQVSGKELNEIADESSTQTELQRKLVDLFTQVLNELKPKSSPVTASAGMFGDTKPNEVANRPAKYFRNPAGLVAQNPGKSVVNLGPPRV